MKISDRNFALCMMFPAAAFLSIFVIWPVVTFLTNSFYEISPFAGGSRKFTGFSNYAEALSSGAFQSASQRTLTYTIIVVALEFTLGLTMALIFAALGNRSSIFRTLFMYPLMIAPVVAGLLWRFLLIDNFGIVNQILSKFGLIQTPSQIGWLSNPKIALISASFPDIWLTTSFITLVLFAGLQNLPNDIIEAAKIDGANFPTMLFRVILPLLRPVLAVAVIIRGIDAARAFDIIVIQTGGGPQESTTTLSLLVYRTFTRYGNPGLASAMGSIYLLIMIIVAGIAIFAIWRPGIEK